MATSAISSHGTLLKIHDGSVYTTIAEVLDISGPSYEVRTEETTNHDSAGWAEFTPTIIDGGEVSFEINYYSASTQDAMETDMLAKTKRLFQLVFPLPASGTDTRGFSAYITNVEPQAPVEGVLKMSCTLKITGAVSKTIA
jgi:hypothetical protein